MVGRADVKYSTRGVVSRVMPAIGFALYYIVLSTTPFVLYYTYSTPNHAITITY